MKYAAYLLILVVFLGFFVSGCGHEPVLPPVDRPVCLGTNDTEAVMEACSKVLEDIGFSIEKYDIEAGFIRTRPLRGGQFFELWRHDNVGRKNKGEANIHSLRRVVDVELSEEDGKICVNCIVNVSRFGLVPENKSLSMAESPIMLTGSRSGVQRLEPATDQIYWTGMGSDTVLEDKLLREISQRVSTGEGAQ